MEGILYTPSSSTKKSYKNLPSMYKENTYRTFGNTPRHVPTNGHNPITGMFQTFSIMICVKTSNINIPVLTYL